MLERQYPGIGKAVLDSCAVTVNLEYVDVGQQSEPRQPRETKGEKEEEEGKKGEVAMINIGDEVAIIPPVSSG